MRFAFTASGILQQPLDRYDRASHGHQEAVLIDLGASTISGRGLIQVAGQPTPSTYPYQDKAFYEGGY